MYDLSQMKGQRVIGAVKMDGSQSTLYRDYMHGRTPDFKSNPTWTWLQNFHASFSHWIEEGFRINVEKLVGRRDDGHPISSSDLESTSLHGLEP